MLSAHHQLTFLLLLRLCRSFMSQSYFKLPFPPPERTWIRNQLWKRVPWAREQLYLQEEMTNANVLLVKLSSTQRTVSRTILCFYKYQSMALSSVYLAKLNLLYGWSLHEWNILSSFWCSEFVLTWCRNNASTVWLINFAFQNIYWWAQQRSKIHNW